MATKNASERLPLSSFLNQRPSLDSFVIPKKVIPYSEISDKPRSTASFFMESLKNVGKGIVKGVGGQLAGASELGEKMLQKLTGVEKPTGVEELKLKEKLEAKGTGEKIGAGIAEVATFFLPGGASTKLGKAAELAMGAKKGAKLLGLGARAGAEAGIFGGITALQKGEVGEEAKQAAMIGAAFPLAGALIKPSKKIIGEGVSQLLGRSTGAGEGAIKEAFNNPDVIKFARQAGVEGAEGLQRKAVEEAKSALQEIKTIRGKEYVSKFATLRPNPQQSKKIFQEVRAKVDELISPSRYDIGIKKGEIDFSRSTITEGQPAIKKALTDIIGWKNLTTEGLDILKKRLGDYISQAGIKTPAKALLSELKSTLTKGLENIKGYKEMTSSYREASLLIEELEKGLSLGDRASIETASKKLMSSMRQNFELRKEMLQTLERYGGKDITGKIAGATFAPIAPRGLAGTMFPGAGAAGVISAIFNPAAWPMVITYLAASSPRLVGEFISVMGSISRLPGGIKNPILMKQLQRIFGEAEGVKKPPSFN